MAEPKGALAAESQAGSPADKAGIKPGDIITSIDNKPIVDTHEFIKRVGETPPGTSVNLTIMRDGQEKRMTVALGEFPRQETRGPDKEPDEGATGESSKSSKSL